MQVASSHKFVLLFAIWLLQLTTIIPTAAFVFAPSIARASTMMMIRSPRTFTTNAWRSMLGQTTTTLTTTTNGIGGQSLRLFASKNPSESSSSFELQMPLDSSQDKEQLLTRTVVRRMNNDQIKAELEKRDIPSHGNKTERADRLLTVIPSKRGYPKSAAEKSAANHTINNNNNRTINNTINNRNSKNETVYKEITPVINGMDGTTSSEESKNEPGPVESPFINNDVDETTSSEDSNKEPGPIDAKRNYTLRVKGVSTKGTGGTGVGIVLEDSEDPTLCWTARKYLLGDRSVFEAEYSGLVLGLRYAVRRGARNINMEIDHDITTGHMKGIYEVTKPGLIPMFQTITEIRDSLQSFSISRITKTENGVAQDLAHKAHATRISLQIEDSVDPMDGQDTQVKKNQRVPEQQQTPIEVSVEPSEEQDLEVEKEQKLPEQQQRQGSRSFKDLAAFAREDLKPTEEVAPVETNESSVAKTGQPEFIQIDPTRLYTLEFDGGARGNQYSTTGVSGAGAVIYDERGKEVWCGWKYLSKMTNNAAEYEALLLGLEGAKSLGIKRLAAFGDSQLIINQVNGKNKVSSESMKEYWRLVMPLMRSFKSITLTHFLREENKRADQLANHAMDTETTHQELLLFDELN